MDIANQFSKVAALIFTSMKPCVNSLAAPQPVLRGTGSFKHCSRSGGCKVASLFVVLAFTSPVTNSVGHPYMASLPFMRCLFKSLSISLSRSFLWVDGSSLFILVISPLSDMIYVLQISLYSVTFLPVSFDNISS